MTIWDKRIRLVFQITILSLIISIIGCGEHVSSPNAKIPVEEKIDSSTRTIYPLLYLPPVISSQSNHDTSTSIILTTADVARFDNKTEDKPYVNSIQIIDADQPWPPRWYATTPVYTDEMFNKDNEQMLYRFDFVVDAKIDTGYFSFYKILSKQKKGVSQLDAPDFAGYILLNEKMEAVDTIKSNVKRTNMYFHDLRLNTKGERMVDLKKNTYLDLRDYTDNPKDSSVHCNVDHIQILDSNDKTIFMWNPLHHLDPELFQFKETIKSRAFASTHADLIEWTRLTSALWDYDGNVLYAMKQIGIGKISREHGYVIWQINNSDLPIISGEDTVEWYSPHDFNLLSDNATSVTYSLYSNGKPEAKPACGVIFEMDKNSNKIRLVKYIWPKTVYIANGQGNLEYYPNGDYAIGYGFFEQSDTNAELNYRSVLEYKLSNGYESVYQLPKHIYTYKARLLRNWPRPPRPLIVLKGDLLKVEGEMKDWIWYKLSDTDYTTITKVGKGSSIKPENGSTYCVEGKYGIGYSVSRPYKYHKN